MYVRRGTDRLSETEISPKTEISLNVRETLLLIVMITVNHHIQELRDFHIYLS